MIIFFDFLKFEFWFVEVLKFKKYLKYETEKIIMRISMS